MRCSTYFFIPQDNRVARVIAPLRAHDDVRVLGEKIDDLAFAFVAPLGTDKDGIRHEMFLEKCVM